MPILPDIEFELNFPEQVTLIRMPPEVDDVILASAKLRLANRGLEKAESDMAAGNVHFWEILDSGGTTIDTIHEMAKMDMVHLEIPPGGQYPTGAPESHGVLVNGKKFTKEGRYQLKYRYWGAEESAWFELKINQ